MIRFGILGYGKMGRIRAETLHAHPETELVAVYDPAVSSAPERVVRDYRQILSDPQVDAVFICTPNHLNKQFTIEALQAGKHVFCEKPPALNTAEILEVIAAEKRAKKKLMYGFNHRQHESILQMKEMVTSGRHGQILWMRGRYGKSVPASFGEDWRSNKAHSGGGILIDQGIHMLDLFLYLAGEFDKVKAVVSNLYWKSDIEDNVFAILQNSQTGVVASLHSTMTQWRHLFSLEVFLERGYMVLNGLKTSSNSYGEEILTVAKNRTAAPAATWEDEEKFVFKTDQSWQRELDLFMEAITKDREILVSGSSEALNLMKLIDKVYEDGKS